MSTAREILQAAIADAEADAAKAESKLAALKAELADLEASVASLLSHDIALLKSFVEKIGARIGIVTPPAAPTAEK